ncbi:MAG: AzlD domain-containing protein, partial [Deltaproteobacteria bacterium]|nr:AzlD domain-containing protein [Deltaproteobacteria bacterium]
FLLAAIPTFLVAWRFKSFFGTVAAGMGLVALGRFFFS